MIGRLLHVGQVSGRDKGFLVTSEFIFCSVSRQGSFVS